jgi:hypothetical protein
MENTTNIYDLLDQVQQRPAMYLGNGYTGHSLQAFVMGFTLAASESQLIKGPYPDFGYFNTWALGHLGKQQESTAGWYELLQEIFPTNDAQVCKAFFDMLDVFRRSGVFVNTMLVDPKALETGYPDAVTHIRRTVIGNSSTVWMEWLNRDQVVLKDTWHCDAEVAGRVLQQTFEHVRKNWQFIYIKD